MDGICMKNSRSVRERANGCYNPIHGRGTGVGRSRVSVKSAEFLLGRDKLPVRLDLGSEKAQRLKIYVVLLMKAVAVVKHCFE